MQIGRIDSKTFHCSKNSTVSAASRLCFVRQVRLCLALYYSKKLLWAQAVLLGKKTSNRIGMRSIIIRKMFLD